MKKLTILWVIAVLALAACKSEKPGKLTSYVNPLIGTDANGHTFPGATMPFGMVQLSPDTKLEGWQGCSGYHAEDSVIYGFSHTHLSGTGCEDYCDILVAPTTGEVKWDNKEYRSNFRHETEKASPGFYAVTLDKYKIGVELTATKRVGFHKYTFPEGKQSNILFDLKHRDMVLDNELTVTGKDEISGYRISRAWAKEQRIYFVAKFSKPFASYKLTVNDSLISNDIAHVKGASPIKAAFTFDTKKDEAVLVKVGISAVSVENARLNLDAELAGWDFEKVKNDADSAWEKELGKIQVEGGTKDDYIKFYTALYHATIVPNLYMDVNGEYFERGKIGKADFDNYTLFSLWDTYRAAHPLYTIIDTKRNEDFIKSFIRLYEEGGLLPVWELAGNETYCMIGHHAVSVIADAYMKGNRNFDVAKAYEACKKSADTALFGLQFFIKKGYIPLTEESESVSKTLEYAYDAWCIAQMAKDMGKQDDYKEYIERAQYYKNIYDAQTGFMRAKNNETWFSPFDPREVNFNYTEANSWQYSFYAPQDVNGLAKLHGGRENLVKKLDEMFVAPTETTGRDQSDITGLIGQYAHGNEPSHHAIYLYNYLGQPWKAQKLARQIMDELYTAKSDGLCGNEDCGQMSAWLVMSAMGLYQVAPGLPQYVIGTPLFKKVTINLENGKKFIITADKPSKENCYIQSAQLNGKDYPKSFITHKDIMNGGEIDFKMGSKPSTTWGIGEGNEPVSEITEHVIVPVPSITKGLVTFSGDNNVVEMKAFDGAKIYYTLDGSVPTTHSTLYTQPITIKETTAMRAIAEKDGVISKEITPTFTKIPGNRKIHIEYPYAPQYSAGGDMALIDYIKGTRDFRSGTWQGYNGVDLVATVDLGEMQMVKEVSTGFMQDTYSWIFMPLQVEYFISADGKNFTSVGVVKHNIDPKADGGVRFDFAQKIGKKTQYIKVVAKNFGKCPAWHVGAGSPTWLFADEIVIK